MYSKVSSEMGKPMGLADEYTRTAVYTRDKWLAVSPQASGSFQIPRATAMKGTGSTTHPTAKVKQSTLMAQSILDSFSIGREMVKAGTASPMVPATKEYLLTICTRETEPTQYRQAKSIEEAG